MFAPGPPGGILSKSGQSGPPNLQWRARFSRDHNGHILIGHRLDETLCRFQVKRRGAPVAVAQHGLYGSDACAFTEDIIDEHAVEDELRDVELASYCIQPRTAGHLLNPVTHRQDGTTIPDVEGADVVREGRRGVGQAEQVPGCVMPDHMAGQRSVDGGVLAVEPDEPVTAEGVAGDWADEYHVRVDEKQRVRVNGRGRLQLHHLLHDPSANGRYRLPEVQPEVHAG